MPKLCAAPDEKKERMSIQVGQAAERSMTVTTEIVRQYAELTGDHNPLHFDE